MSLPRRYVLYALALLTVLTWDSQRLQRPSAPALPEPRFVRTPPLPPLPSVIFPDDTVAQIGNYPNTAIRTYTVTGATRLELARAMLANQPEDMKARGHFYAYTSWHVDWNWPADGQGNCDLRKATLAFSAIVTLPSLEPGVAMDPTVLESWNRFRKHLVEHEAGHLRHAYAHVADIADAIHASTCGTAHQAALDALHILAAYDAAYDAQTHHGATQGAVFP